MCVSKQTKTLWGTLTRRSLSLWGGFGFGAVGWVCVWSSEREREREEAWVLVLCVSVETCEYWSGWKDGKKREVWLKATNTRRPKFLSLSSNVLFYWRYQKKKKRVLFYCLIFLSRTSMLKTSLFLTFVFFYYGLLVAWRKKLSGCMGVCVWMDAFTFQGLTFFLLRAGLMFV